MSKEEMTQFSLIIKEVVEKTNKTKIMNESFSVYLFILSLLRDNDLIDEFVSSLNNN